MPPIIQADPSNQSSPTIGDIIWLNAEDPTPREWEFAVVVIEEDLSRPLEARVRLVKRDDPMPFYTTLSPLPAGTRVRQIKFKISSTQLSYNECHHLQLAVSGSFFKDRIPNVDPRTLFAYTKEREDLALANWWIWEGQGAAKALASDKARIVETCPTNETVPSTGTSMPEAMP